MTVTKLETVTKTKYKVFLDGQFAFVLYKGELARYHIKEGALLEEAVRQKIWDEVIVKRARLRAMHLLEDMDRTESGLREKLRQGLYPEEAIEAAVQYVKSFHYIDDFRYAKQFIESRKSLKSRKEIYALLRGKGVAADKIDLAFEECYESEGEKDAIRQIIRKKRINLSQADSAEIQRLYGYLSRKGFRYEDIRQVTQNYDENA
ncbi:regulatory protein RecX [Faecalicatena contorta]|uniref:Regulatory protein RecX n=1 Tax=Faecalicatena contorta TaxID=39482 RepID=A0A316A4J5_9FIRM|nr:regulatory protein RecX [Faecalicatena contorta]PWJ51870.1 regulatory protein [Faecalicatena contorta]SUQ12143.1 regulatory protein [Faecalicatena contorta]